MAQTVNTNYLKTRKVCETLFFTLMYSHSKWREQDFALGPIFCIYGKWYEECCIEGNSMWLFCIKSNSTWHILHRKYRCVTYGTLESPVYGTVYVSSTDV